MRNFLFLLLIGSSGFCEENEKAPDIEQISEAMGHLIGKNLQELGVHFEFSALVKGLLDASSGKEPPLNEDECIQAIASLQEETFSLSSEKNLEEAEKFLQENKKVEEIISLEEGKIQYKIGKLGQGNSVQSYNCPQVRYTARYLNGQTLETTEGDEILFLDETIPGFRKGVIGMQEGETRTLFIHPDLGYGSSGLNPNALLIFEVEVVKADTSKEAHAASAKEDLAPSLPAEPFSTPR